MNLELFIAKRITFKSNRKFSKIIVRLAIAAIALSVAVMLITVSVVVGFKSEIEQKITGFSAPIQVTGEFLNTSYENKALENSIELRQTILDFDFVKKIQPFALKPSIIKFEEDFEGIVLKGITKDFDVDFFSSCLIKGRFITFEEEGQTKEIVLSNTIADKLNIDTGAYCQLWFVQEPPLIKKLKVVGIYQTDIEEVDAHFVLSDLSIIQQVNGWEESQVGGLEVLLHDLDFDLLPDQNSDLRYAIDIDLNSMSIVNRYPQIFDWLHLIDKNVNIIITLMTIVAIINMITALLIMILERTQMIGILKSLGYANGRLMRIFVFNASFFIGYGLLIGNVIGLSLLFLQYHLGIISLPSDYYVTRVPISFPWSYFILINLGTMILCSLAMFVPSLSISKIIPIKALRFS